MFWRKIMIVKDWGWVFNLEIRSALWFLSLPSTCTSVDPRSNPTSDWSLQVGSVVSFPAFHLCGPRFESHLRPKPSGWLFGFFPCLSPLWTPGRIPPQTGAFRLALWFLSLPFTSVDLGSNPTSDGSLQVGSVVSFPTFHLCGPRVESHLRREPSGWLKKIKMK